jgi:DNA-binding transcriptional regulator YhcF (GntR family)
MPPLPKGPALRAKDHKAERLLEILRGIAVTNQRNEPQPFYPLRDVASRFQVPVSTVARVYGQLEDEGILTSIRGSKTILQGLSSAKHLSVRGIVALPASLSRFVTVQDYRMFFIRTLRELRRKDFATATVFLERSDESPDRLVRRMKKYKVDTILWYLPNVAAREIALRLNDVGIRVLGVSDGSLSDIVCCYEVHREAAITAILRDWQSSSGIKSVTIVRGIRSAAYEERLEAILEKENLAREVVSLSQRVDRFLDSLGEDQKRGILFLSSAASMFSFRSPENLSKLLRSSRVCFVGGPVSIPFAKAPDAKIDLVLVDWQLVAERIVNDLVTKQASEMTDTTVFEARHQLQVPLNQYAQSF